MNITLVRHGQAGTRLAYDTLSAIGCQQATLLGRHLASGPAFDKWVSGSLERQSATASLASMELASQPDIAALPGWNEFDLDRVYEGIAPELARRSEAFKTHWDTVKALVDLHGDNETALVNRRWSPADEMVVRAWVNGEVDYDGESWKQFRERIRAALYGLIETKADSAIVFTSATPAAICVGEALGIADGDIFQLAGAMMNTAITELRWRQGKVRLFSFNNAPHLSDAALRTHR